MNTIVAPPPGRRRRRLHSDEFKANAVAAVSQPGVSMAAVAMSLGINANLLRRWVHDVDAGPAKAGGMSKMANVPPTSAFVAVQLPAPSGAAPDIRVELRRGPTTVVVSWPAAAASECAAWMRELLR